MQLTLGWLWFLVFITLNGFFLLAERRYRGRGLAYLGMMTVCVGALGLADAWVMVPAAPLLSLFLARSTLVLGFAAVAFNTHFLCLFFESAQRRALIWASYVMAGGGIFSNVVATLQQARHVQALRFPEQYRVPSQEFFVYFSLVALISTCINLLVLFPAAWKRKSPARGMLVAVILFSPLTLTEVYFMIRHGQRWYLIEGATWAYSLIVIASLISEFKGTEGLLQQTTSNLAARTAELESSYAEIDLMASELSRKQQLAAVGELAAAIAHEVRNPLAIIMNAVSAMKRPTISGKDRETLLDIVNEESERLNHLVAELLRFARPVTAARSPVSLYDICEQASQAAPPGFELRVQTSVDEELGPVLVDPALFRLALDNLIANSCQAMPKGGVIELMVRRGQFSDGALAATVLVKDQGAGMDKLVLSNAKKPFFTTKPRGTGLGIPIAQKIVEAHGGEMELLSSPGAGTTVSIALPLEKELLKSVGYGEGIKSATRRRLRSIPPVQLSELVAASADLAAADGRSSSHPPEQVDPTSAPLQTPPPNPSPSPPLKS
ncbi:MAG TPA: ATP-binding protein [Polyangiaceae bacterium]|nr:ATP-binding protein [Polyangiaceae bacterium]